MGKPTESAHRSQRTLPVEIKCIGYFARQPRIGRSLEPLRESQFPATVFVPSIQYPRRRWREFSLVIRIVSRILREIEFLETVESCHDALEETAKKRSGVGISKTRCSQQLQNECEAIKDKEFDFPLLTLRILTLRLLSWVILIHTDIPLIHI